MNDRAHNHLTLALRANSPCMAMQIDGNRMICGYMDGYIKMFDLRTGRCHRNLYSHVVRETPYITSIH